MLETFCVRLSLGQGTSSSLLRSPLSPVVKGTTPKAARERERHNQGDKGRGWVGNGEMVEGKSYDSERGERTTERSVARDLGSGVDWVEECRE